MSLKCFQSASALRFPSYDEARASGPSRANQRLLRACLMPLSSVMTDMTSFFKGIAPEPQINWLQSGTPFGSPRASGWTERPDRGSQSAREGQDVRIRRAKLYLRVRHHEAVTARAAAKCGQTMPTRILVLRTTGHVHSSTPVTLQDI